MDRHIEFNKIHTYKLYNILTFVLLIWCIFQEIVLSFLLKITKSIVLIKILFYFKDFLMIILFLYSFKIKKIKHNAFIVLFIYFP